MIYETASKKRRSCRASSLVRENIKSARLALGGSMTREQSSVLRALSEDLGLSLPVGDLILLEGRWYVTHAGLLRLARRRQCSGIKTVLEGAVSDPSAGRWVFKATVYKVNGSRGFVGYGDADPSNVSPLMRGAEMRMAETRAVSRALRKAYGIGLCSVEELGWSPRATDRHLPDPVKSPSNGDNAHRNGQPRLRDRLCLLIRQHQLDPNLVKAYAADYCGTAALKDASRDLVEAFINDLAERATKDREVLLCHLNSYAKAPEVNS